MRWEEAELLRALKSHSSFLCLVEDAPRGRKEKKEEEEDTVRGFNREVGQDTLVLILFILVLFCVDYICLYVPLRSSCQYIPGIT